MARRYRIKKGRGKGQQYVVRRKSGQFQSFSNIGRSIRADTRQTAFSYKGKGYGHLGDAASAPLLLKSGEHAQRCLCPVCTGVVSAARKGKKRRKSRK